MTIGRGGNSELEEVSEVGGVGGECAGGEGVLEGSSGVG